MNVSMTNFSMPMMGNRNASGMPPPPPPPPQDQARGGFEPQSTEDILTSLDSDESGALSADEVADSPLANFISEDNWAEVDSDGDDTLSLAELEAHRETVGAPSNPQEAEAASVTETLSMMQNLLTGLAESEAATENTASYAESAYAALSDLFDSLNI